MSERSQNRNRKPNSQNSTLQPFAFKLSGLRPSRTKPDRSRPGLGPNHHGLPPSRGKVAAQRPDEGEPVPHPDPIAEPSSDGGRSSGGDHRKMSERSQTWRRTSTTQADVLYGVAFNRRGNRLSQGKPNRSRPERHSKHDGLPNSGMGHGPRREETWSGTFGSCGFFMPG